MQVSMTDQDSLFIARDLALSDKANFILWNVYLDTLLMAYLCLHFVA